MHDDVIFINRDNKQLYRLNLPDRKVNSINIGNKNISKKTEVRVISKNTVVIISPIVIKNILHYHVDIFDFKKQKNKSAILKTSEGISSPPYIGVYDLGDGKLLINNKIKNNYISIIDYKNLKLSNEHHFLGTRNDGLIYLDNRYFIVLKKGVGEIHANVYKINQDDSITKENDFGINLDTDYKKVILNNYVVNDNIIYFIGGMEEYTTSNIYSNNSFELNLENKTLTRITQAPDKIGKTDILFLDKNTLLLFGGYKSALLSLYGAVNTNFYEYKIIRKGK